MNMPEVESERNAPSILMSHPTGNQYVRNALRSLVEHDMLCEFWTTIAWNEDSVWNRTLPASLKRQLLRRSFRDVPQEKLHSVPWREIVRLGIRSTPIERTLCSDERAFSVIAMFRNFDERVAQRLSEVRPDGVYAHEGGARTTFREARELNIATLYELPSGYWDWECDLMREEEALHPEFASVIPKLSDSAKHIQWKEEELALADCVFVPSEHVKRTLHGVVPQERIRVVQYGAPPVRSREVGDSSMGGPLKVVFAGALHQRKGIGYLLEAIDGMGMDAELTLIGQRLAPNPIVDAACSRWRWFESIPHEEVLDIMRGSDVLVLPSLSEGFGMVVTEALACGLPVIVTSNVGAGDVIRDGVEGFVVPIRSAEAIAECLDRLHRDRTLLAEMSHNAQCAAAENSWSTYRERWVEAVGVAVCQ